MHLVLGRFEDGPHRAKISEILGPVWIGLDIMIDYSLHHDGEPVENPCWNQTNPHDHTIYDLVWISMFGNFLMRYQGEHPNTNMLSLCWCVCEAPTPRSLSTSSASLVTEYSPLSIVYRS